MSTEPTPEISPAQSNVNRVSIGALTAIIIAIAAIIFCLQNFYMIIREKMDAQAQQQTMITLQNNFAQLQNNRQVRAQRIMANINYLVHIANLHLMIDHDPAAALKILLIAQQEIASSNDENLTALKQALLSDIATLRAAPDVNVNKLFSTLSVLNQQIQALSPIPTQPAVSLKKTVDDMKLAGENLPWYKRALESLKQLKNLFVIRHLNQPNTPLITSDMEANLKQNIIMQLNMAQWALLHRDEKVYQMALQNVSRWLTQYFALSAAKDPIIAQLAALEKMQIETTLPMINNTLNALTELSPIKLEKEVAIPDKNNSQTLPKQKEKKGNLKSIPADVET